MDEQQEQPPPPPRRAAARVPLGDLLALLAGAHGVVVEHRAAQAGDGDGGEGGGGGGDAASQTPEGLVAHLRRSGVLTR